MVQVEKLRVLVNQSTGEDFIVLDLVSEPVIKMSLTSGKPYLTVLKSEVSFCTFSKEVAEKMVGTKLPGKIEKREVDQSGYYKSNHWRGSASQL